MSRHAADKPRTPETGERLRRYTEIERETGGPRPQTALLQRRAREERSDGRRAQEYVRIERGETE